MNMYEVGSIKGACYLQSTHSYENHKFVQRDFAVDVGFSSDYRFDQQHHIWFSEGYFFLLILH